MRTPVTPILPLNVHPLPSLRPSPATSQTPATEFLSPTVLLHQRVPALALQHVAPAFSGTPIHIASAKSKPALY